MLELFSLFKYVESIESFNNHEMSLQKDTFETSNSSNGTLSVVPRVPTSWIIIALIISFCSAYLAYCCNEYEKPVTRTLSTILAFFFSGFYLIYYFIYHILFDRKCSSRGINNIVKNIVNK